MTVSRVLNGGSNVSPDRRAAVERAIAQLHYSPNIAARRLAGGRSVSIGLLYSNPSASYLSEFLVGGLDQAQRRDVQLLVEKCDPGESELIAARHLLKSGVDALMKPIRRCPRESRCSVIVRAAAVASGLPIEGLISISIDDFAAARTMTEHLLSLGHRRIGFIVGSQIQAASARRRDGYVAALATAGIDPDPQYFAQGDFTYRSGLDAAERLLSLPKPPTAIFASNDDMAVATVAVAHRKGIDVPGDLSVCGFDDTPLATTIWPELTTVRQPVAEMASAAVDLLFEQVVSGRTGSDHTDRRTFPFTVVRRETDGPVAKD
jgi:LacI family transcriptional regulator